jgi:hypothetical protein
MTAKMTLFEYSGPHTLTKFIKLWNGFQEYKLYYWHTTDWHATFWIGFENRALGLITQMVITSKDFEITK